MNRVKWLFSLEGRVWSASILNAVFMLLQLWTTIQTHSIAGLDWRMLAGFLYVQVTFVQYGYKSKQWGIFGGMLASAVFTTTILLLMSLWRNQ